MKKWKTDIAIVNRSFWPDGQVIGEALLKFSEDLSEEKSVCVITQAAGDLASILGKAGRARQVKVYEIKSHTTSASSVTSRIMEAVVFTLWTLFNLLRARPQTVYVSTNPPLIVPFFVAIYCRLFGASYIYHLQDIHPEAANIVVPVKRIIFRVLQFIDNYTLRHADALVTLSEEMRDYLLGRSGTKSQIYLIDNPSLSVDTKPFSQRIKGAVFCGNAGRLQRIPLLVSAIRDYLEKGGTLRFTFAGGGVYAQDIRTLAEQHEEVEYLGVVSTSDAAALVAKHWWALLPIDDEVTRYAFPSKSSGYALAGAAVAAICGAETSVARWVNREGVGLVCPPDKPALVSFFSELENISVERFSASDQLKERLAVASFSASLREVISEVSSV